MEREGMGTVKVFAAH